MSEAFPCSLPAQPGDIVPVNSPPDYVKQVSRFLTPWEQQGGQEANSDSGDSLFITQKCAPKRPRRPNHGSSFRAHGGDTEDEYETSRSTSEEENQADRRRRKKSYRMPKFVFPFLNGGRMSGFPSQKNRKLHYFAMGGFFRCAEQLMESYGTGHSLEASLPTVDANGEPLSPLSEEEDNYVEDEDIRVVEKKTYVVSKARRPQPWYNPKKRSSEETLQSREHSPAARGPGILAAQRDKGKINRSPRKVNQTNRFDPVDNGRLRDDGDAVDDTECGRIKVKKKKKDRGGDELGKEEKYLETSERRPVDPCVTMVTTEEEEALFRKKKKKKGENEDPGQLDERTEDVPAVEGDIDADSLESGKAAESKTNDGRVRKRRKKKKTDSTDVLQTPTPQREATDHSGNGDAFQETLESADFKRKKHKKKNRSTSNNNKTDVDLGDATTAVESTDFVVEKKNLSGFVGPFEEDEGSVEITQRGMQDCEKENGKRKKKKKDRESGRISNSEDTLESAELKKKRTPPSLSADDGDERSDRKGKPEVGVCESAGGSADVSEPCLGSEGGEKKKKEKCEAAVKKKHKRRRTESLTESSETVAPAGSSQTEEEVVVRKKKKKKKKAKEEILPSAGDDPESAKSPLSAGSSPCKEKHKKHGLGAGASCSSGLFRNQQVALTRTEDASDPRGVKKRPKRKSDKPYSHAADADAHEAQFHSTSSETFPSGPQTSSAHCVKGRKRANAKRPLYNGEKDFLSDLNC